MTEIEKVKGEIKVLEKKLALLEEIETHKSLPKMSLENEGKFEVVSYNDEIYYRLEYSTDVIWYKRKEKLDGILLKQITDAETKRLLEMMYLADVYVKKEFQPSPQTPEQVAEGLRDAMRQAKKDGVFDEPSKPMDDVVNRLVKKYQAQKLWNRVRDELGYSIDCCDEIVDLVQKWLPEYQSAAGSQNVDTELLVDGFNHCLDKIKMMLR